MYEIPVGPVHAGLIEPGHFRFSVAGETVLRLKARLWFVHRGIEKLFEGRPAHAAVELAERVSGDTSVAHALAHSLAVEDALGVTVPDDVHRLRALLVELERLYNHVADLGALANDVGFGLANVHAQRIREQLLRINATVTGHRLLRGAIAPGAVTLRALPDAGQLRSVAADVAELADLTLGNSLVYDRFAATAILLPEDARALGCLGYVARASGLRIDARLDHPTTALPVTEVGATAGDVLARYTVRRDEFAASTELACHLIESHCGPTQYTVSGGPEVRRPRGRRHRRRLARHRRAPTRDRRGKPDHPRQDRRPVLVQLAGAAGRDGRHHRPGLPAGQQELQPVLRRQRPLTQTSDPLPLAGQGEPPVDRPGHQPIGQ